MKLAGDSDDARVRLLWIHIELLLQASADVAKRRSLFHALPDAHSREVEAVVKLAIEMKEHDFVRIELGVDGVRMRSQSLVECEHDSSLGSRGRLPRNCPRPCRDI